MSHPFSLLLYHHAPSPKKYVRIHPFLLLLSSHSQYRFDVLDVYIQSQKALLARTQSDIDRLRLLREQAAANPEHFFDSFDEKVFDRPLSSTHYNLHNHSSMTISFALIISQISLRRSKTRSIGTYSKDKVHPPLPPLLLLCLLEKILPPFAPSPPISVQRNMRDRNHQQHSKAHCRQPSSSYEPRGGL